MLLAGLLLAWPACHAVLFKASSDPNYNTSAPDGSLTNSGWQWQGEWLGSYLGTAIAPTFFITAGHVGGSTNELFFFNGFYYHTIAFYDDPSSDLRIWKVAETFPTYALLYTNSNELGQHCAVFGRGKQRGPAVIVSGVTNGWQWGVGDSLRRWGENDVSDTITDLTYGSLLTADFDRDANSNECHMTEGDSGGAMFIQDASNVWRLAGIHLAVDGPYSNAVDGVFRACLMDRGGQWENTGAGWTFVHDTGADKPSAFYSTRVSSHVAWINSVIDFEPGNDLRITGIAPVGNDVQVYFATGTNKVYRIEYRDDLASGAWATLTNGVVGTGDIMTATDTGAATAPQRFYRVGLVP